MASSLNHDKEVKSEDFTQERSIGEGTNFKYFCGSFTKPRGDNRKFALKVLKNSRGEGLLKEEIKALDKIRRHGNILYLQNYCTKGPQKFLVFEYANKGNLYDFLRESVRDRNEESLLLEQTLINFFTQIALGVKYLIENKIFHHDLAACNILVSKEGEANFVLKVTDFWRPSKFDEKKFYTTKTSHDRFPFLWQAPEILEKFNESQTEKSVAWSFAVLMWEIYSFGFIRPYHGYSSNIDAFDSESLLNALWKNQRMERPHLCYSDDVFELMKECWQANAQLGNRNRPNFKDIILKLGIINLLSDYQFSWEQIDDIKSMSD